ncbi:hypothetical protein HKD37_15G043814 [Glycine soja]
MAKELRKFVQNINMSRKSFNNGEYPLARTLNLPLAATKNGDTKLKFKKKQKIGPQELRIDQTRITSLTESNPKRNNYVTPNNQRIQKCKPTSSRAASKWNDYLTEDNENLELAWKKSFNLEEHSGPRNNILEAITIEICSCFGIVNH